MVGLTAAEALGQAFASFPARGLGRGCQLEIPLGEGSSLRSIQRRLITMIEENRTTAEISRQLGVHERTIRRWRRRINDSLPEPAARLASRKIAAE
ncbi:helix-turn-helix domain-containing protein [Methylorubrum sp. SL192]|uniref:helix-turn-helix domain-containing protein n=1 Tax=Methylorubrum sp. SL192 TaxID=2995167 RepID=UPI003FA364CE